MREVSRRVYTGVLGAWARLRRGVGLMFDGRDELEATLAQRSAQLSSANERLQKEIREREAAQAELGELGARYRLLLDSVSEGIYGLDRNGCISFANRVAARLMAQPVEELIGRPQHEFVGHRVGVDRPCSDGGCPIERAVADGVHQLGTCELRRGRDGTSIEIEYVSAPIRSGIGVTGAIVVFREVTSSRESGAERMGLDTRARRAEKVESLGVMAGGIAHDFSNLLAVILGQTSVALEELPPESPARSNLERAVAATRRAGAVAQQLFVYAGLGAFEYQDLLLNDLIRENVSLFRGVIPPNIELRPLLAEELPYIDADPGPIQQVVMNLILNAVEAIGPTGGSVTLSTGTRTVEGEEAGPSMYTTDPLAPGRYVTLSVEDTGTGMDAESLVKIFDPFFTTKVAGRGLGLATVLGVVRAHRGGVEVESELGKGTALRLLFPEGCRAAPVEASCQEPKQ